MKKECAGWYMNSHRRRNQDWQAFGQHRRRKTKYFALCRPLNEAEKRARLEKALHDINAKYGENTIRVGKNENEMENGNMAD